MLCLGCTAPGRRLCGECRQQMWLGPPRSVGHDLTVFPALVHEGVARRLVHQLKYQGVNGIASLLGSLIRSNLPSDTRALVPIPRTWARRVRFGIDPGRELATEVGRLAGLPIVDCLAAPLWSPANAGQPRGQRRRPEFRQRRPAPRGAVLVDDVITTGATLAAAAGVLELSFAVTATSAGV